MTRDLYTVDKVAEILGMHVRTVRGYIREGRIKAVRIGKQYRITREDLEAFTGVPTADDGLVSATRTRFSEVASVTQIDAISADDASRITNSLMAATNGRRDDNAPVRVDSIYDETRARLKIIINGSIQSTIGLLQLVNLYVDQKQ
jgi:excisionase family DNA binding protein